MSLHLHSAACEAWLTEPPEYDDLFEGVEYPRERKPWKRDRHELRRLAMLVAQQRGPWVRDDHGWDHNLHHSRRFAGFAQAQHHHYRLRVIGDLFSAYECSEEKRYWRCALSEAKLCNKVPLP